MCLRCSVLQGLHELIWLVKPALLVVPLLVVATGSGTLWLLHRNRHPWLCSMLYCSLWCGGVDSVCNIGWAMCICGGLYSIQVPKPLRQCQWALECTRARVRKRTQSVVLDRGIFPERNQHKPSCCCLQAATLPALRTTQRFQHTGPEWHWCSPPSDGCNANSWLPVTHVDSSSLNALRGMSEDKTLY